MSELAIFMPTGKVAVRQLEGRLREMYLSGDHDPLEIEIKLKGVADAIDTTRKDTEVRGAVLNALSMYSEKTIDLDGAQVQRRNTPARYAYDACNDPVYDRLKAQMEALKQDIKDRENFLKAMKKTEVIVDQETGEAVEVNPPPKVQGETLAIKFV